MNEERLNDEGKKWNGRALSQFELDSSLDCVLFFNSFLFDQSIPFHSIPPLYLLQTNTPKRIKAH